METVINHENRNELAKRVISGEVPVEKATIGLARVEVKIFYRKVRSGFPSHEFSTITTDDWHPSFD